MLPNCRCTSPAGLAHMQPYEALDIERLLRHSEATAGGLMATEFVSLPQDLTVQETIERLRELEPEAETIYYVYILNGDQRLVGVLSAAATDRSRPGSSHQRDHGARAGHRAPFDGPGRGGTAGVEVQPAGHPGVDAESKMLGIVTWMTVMDVLEEEASEDLYRLSVPQPLQKRRLHSRWRGFTASAFLPWRCCWAAGHSPHG